MISRVIGGILLIVGTSIGGGMLALPIANAGIGFFTSTLLLIFCWLLMTIGAFYILEANLYLPRGKNMVSMAHLTLGPIGLVIAWFSYLFLLYALLAAYIAGGGDILGTLIRPLAPLLSNAENSILFTLAFGFIVYGGIKPVDWANRALMFGKLGIYLLLVVFIAPHVQLPHLQHVSSHLSINIIMVLITSFGFAIIIPNLRDYFEDNISTLKKVILIGSIIPLLCYLAWNAVIIGSLPHDGPRALSLLMHDSNSTSALASLISQTIQRPFISALFNTFTAICMLTAFLGVSLCLVSFLSDGLHIDNSGFKALFLSLLTFAPPLLLVIYAPGIYISALSYAGIFCVILLLLLPVGMSYFGRKRYTSTYLVPGGKVLQCVMVMTSVALLIFSIKDMIL